MKCQRAMTLLPLAAAGDLPRRKAGRLEAHLKQCPGCRQELQAYRAALSEIRSLARSEPQPDWPETEWRRIMKRATAQRPKEAHWVFGHPNRRLAWTLGSALVLVLAVGAIVILRQGRNKEYSRQPAPAVVSHYPGRAKTPSRPGQSPQLSSGLKESGIRPQVAIQPAPGAKEVRAGQAIQARVPKKQDVLNMVFVSPESGLTIHWVFNSQFEWKEK